MNDEKNQAQVSPEPDPKPATAATPAAGKDKPKKSAETLTGVTMRLKDIILPEDWNREKLTNIPQLAASIKEVGLIQPIVVIPIPDKPGKVELNDGRRRYAALQELGTDRVEVHVKTDVADDTKAFLTSLVANLNREDNTDYEIAVALKKLSESGMKHKEIARAVGKTEGFVSQHITAMNAPEDVIKAFRKGDISFAKMRVFARLKEEDDAKQVEKVLAMALDPEKTTDDMTESVDLYLAKKHKEKGTKKKGSAAKTKAEKKRGPGLKLQDYDAPETRKLISLISSKDDAVELLNYAKEGRLKAASAKRSSYFDGMLDGMELFARLKVLS